MPKDIILGNKHIDSLDFIKSMNDKLRTSLSYLNGEINIST